MHFPEHMQCAFVFWIMEQLLYFCGGGCALTGVSEKVIVIQRCQLHLLDLKAPGREAGMLRQARSLMVAISLYVIRLARVGRWPRGRRLTRRGATWRGGWRTGG